MFPSRALFRAAILLAVAGTVAFPTAIQAQGSADTAKKIIDGLKDKVDAGKTIKPNPDTGKGPQLPTDIGEIPTDDAAVKFAKNWPQIIAKRKGDKLSDEDAAILKAMSSTVKADFVKQPFQEVVKLLEERSGAKIVIDPNALKEAEIDYSTPVTLEAKKVTLRTALKKILGDVGLAYIVKKGMVQVVTPEVAQKTMTTKAYYVGDLIPPPLPGANPAASLARQKWFANQIMAMIVNTIEPDSWQANGNGLGTISYSPATQQIIIRQTAEAHLSLQSSFGGGK